MSRHAIAIICVKRKMLISLGVFIDDFSRAARREAIFLVTRGALSMAHILSPYHSGERAMSCADGAKVIISTALLIRVDGENARRNGR